MEKDQRDNVSMYHSGGKFRRTRNRPVKTGWKIRIAKISRHDGPPDSMAYTTGLYMGENIRLYYKPGEKTDRPVCVLTVELREDDANGPVLCDLLSYKEFDLKSMENFCLRRYNLIRTGGSFRQWVEDFLSGSIGTENLTGLLRERFMADGFEESLVREELDKLAIRVRHEKGHAAIILRHPE